MSTISVETTARLTICWMASSRSLPGHSPGPPLLTSAARIAWKKPTSSRIRAPRRARGQGEGLGEGQHAIGKASAAPALLLASGVFSLSPPMLLLVENPLDGAGHHGQAFAGRATAKMP
jgi:hypothetical protein